MQDTYVLYICVLLSSMAETGTKVKFAFIDSDDFTKNMRTFLENDYTNRFT